MLHVSKGMHIYTYAMYRSTVLYISQHTSIHFITYVYACTCMPNEYQSKPNYANFSEMSDMLVFRCFFFQRRIQVSFRSEILGVNHEASPGDKILWPKNCQFREMGICEFIPRRVK